MLKTSDFRLSELENEIPDAVRRRNAAYFSLGGLSVVLASAPTSLARAWQYSLIRDEALALSILQGGPSDREQYLRWLEPEDAFLGGEDDLSDRAIALDLTRALARVWDRDYPFRPDAERIRQLLDGATPALGGRRVAGGKEAALWYDAAADLFGGRRRAARVIGVGYHQFGRAIFSLLDAVHEPTGGAFGLMAQHAALLGPVIERQAVPPLLGPTVPVGGALPCPVVGIGTALWLNQRTIEALPADTAATRLQIKANGRVPKNSLEVLAWDRIWIKILERAGEDGLRRYARLAVSYEAWKSADQLALFDLFAERPRQTVTSVAQQLGVSYQTAARRLAVAVERLRDVSHGHTELRKRRSAMIEHGASEFEHVGDGTPPSPAPIFAASPVGKRAIFFQADALL